MPVVNETSAGGLVIRVVEGRALAALIARRASSGRIEWCLPKGHVEAGETIPEAAVREVFEETGITGRVLVHLASIEYWFSSPGKKIHKKVHHYLLESTGGFIGVENDPDHEAEYAEWVDLDQVSRRLAYANEKRVVSLARELLHLDRAK